MMLEGRVALITGAPGVTMTAVPREAYISGQVLFVDGGMSIVR